MKDFNTNLGDLATYALRTIIEENLWKAGEQDVFIFYYRKYIITGEQNGFCLTIEGGNKLIKHFGNLAQLFGYVLDYNGIKI